MSGGWWYGAWGFITITALLSHNIVYRRCVAFSVSKSVPRSYNLKRLVSPADRASLDSFYRDHFLNKKRVTPPAARDMDEVYTLVDSDGSTVAAVRLSPARSFHVFMRSLCVSRAHRRQGVALQLIQKSFADYHNRNDEISTCFCFAESTLCPLYEQAGFCHVVDSTKCPDWMWRSFEMVAKRMKRKHQDMQLFVKEAGGDPREEQLESAMRVILIQHSNEVSRSTSTAQLVLDEKYARTNQAFQSLSEHVTVDRWLWSGRNDTKVIEKRLAEIRYRGLSPILVWTDGNSTFTSSLRRNRTWATTSSLVILDGTWQEARAMFRKIPLLQALPRFSISWSRSTYRLRKDFTGWRERFGSGDENLLCTAEVVAALLGHGGDAVGRDIVLNRLQEFQDNYGRN